MLQQLYDSVFGQPSGFLFWNESLLLGYLCTTVGSPVQRSISMFVDVSLNNSWVTDMCSLFGDGGEKSSQRRFLLCALGVVSCSTTPYRLLSLGTAFREVRRDLPVLAPAVCSTQRPTALRPCVVPRRSSAALSSLLVTAGTPNRLQTVLQLALVVFV